MTWGDSGSDAKRNSQEWDIFPDVPLDIARLIFEKAMEDNPMPVHLALVSRQVQHWVEPLLYRNLTFHDASCFSSFYRTFRSRRFSKSKSTAFFEEHVKSLHILDDASPKMEQLVAIGKGLKGLRSVAGWDDSWGCHVLGFLASDRSTLPDLKSLEIVRRCLDLLVGDKGEWRDEQERRRRNVVGEEDDAIPGILELEALGKEDIVGSPPLKVDSDPLNSDDPFPFKDLRRLSLSAHAVREFRLDFTHRIFRDITHLDIYYCRAYDWSTIKAMKNLTYVAFDFLTLVNLVYIEMETCMDETIRYCQTLPYLKVIIFACVSWWTRDFDLMSMTSTASAGCVRLRDVVECRISWREMWLGLDC